MGVPGNFDNEEIIMVFIEDVVSSVLLLSLFGEQKELE